MKSIIKKHICVTLIVITAISNIAVPNIYAKDNESDITLANNQFDNINEAIDNDGNQFSFEYCSEEESKKNGKTDSFSIKNEIEGETQYDFQHLCIKKVNNSTGEENVIINDADGDLAVSNNYIYYKSYAYKQGDDYYDCYDGVDYVRCDINGNNREVLYHADYTPFGTSVGDPPEFFVTNKYLYISKYEIIQVDLSNKKSKVVYDGNYRMFEGHVWLNTFLVKDDVYYFSVTDNENGTLQSAFFRYDDACGLLPIFYVNEERGSWFWSDNDDGTKTMQSNNTYYTFYAGKGEVKSEEGTKYTGVLLNLADGSPFSELGISFYDENDEAYWFYNFKSNKLEKVIGEKKQANVYFEIDKVKGSTTLTLDSSWFNQDSNSYNHELSKLSSQLVMLGYTDEETVKSALLDLGFEENNIEINKKTARNEVNYYIASKNIEFDGKTYTLVLTSLIGSYYYQWYSNFDPLGRDRKKDNLKTYAKDSEMERYHIGFADAKEFAYLKLNNFLEKHKLSDNIKLLITGHSRGAAAANLLGAKIIKNGCVGDIKIKKEDLFTYTFATPNNAKLTKNEKSNKDYKRIFNIVNPEDFVTKVLPTAWGYSKYGTTYTLPSKSNTNALIYSKYKKNMQEEFSLLCIDDTYHPYPLGTMDVEKVVKSMTSYVSDIDEFYNKKYRAAGIAVAPMDYFKEILCPNVISPQKTDDDKTKAEAAQKMIIATCTVPTTYDVKAASNLFITSKLYNDISWFFVKDQGIGSLTDGWIFDTYFADGHMSQTYCAYMLSMSSNAVTKTKKFWSNSVNCPVDVEVYDKSTGELVGQIVNNEVNADIANKENSVSMYVDGDSKKFDLPNDTAYEVKLIGNDDGKMDYIVSEYDSDIGETARATYFDVDIKKGVAINCDFEENQDSYKDCVLQNEDSAVNQTGYYKFDYNSDGIADNLTFDVNVVKHGNGEIIAPSKACAGDVMTLGAKANSNEQFKGWYIDGEFAGSQEEITLVAKEGMNIEAKFSNKQLIKIIAAASAIIILTALIIGILLKKKNKKTN